MAADLASLLADLADETAVVDAMVSPASDTTYARPTPASGWSVADQLSHLAFFDDAARTAAEDPERFMAEAEALVAGGDGFADAVAERYRGLSPDELLAWFRTSRAALLGALALLDPSTKLPWYGPPMSAATSATARLMESWAHGQDIADALGASHPPTSRLRHVAHLGVRTLGFSFQLHGLDAPDVPVRVELTSPDAGMWTWGPADAVDRVTGSALDFCLVVTQRRHRDDTVLRATGPVAERWLDMAQAFAGPPGPGRPAGGAGTR